MKEGWKLCRLEDLGRIMYGHTAKSSFEKNGPKYLRITDIQKGIVDWENVPNCSPFEDYQKYGLKKGDIVFARTGATTGKSYLIEDEVKAVFASYLIRVEIKTTDLSPEFLYLFFQTPQYWHNINTGISGSAQGGFNAKKLGQLNIPIPQIGDQKEIVALLGKAFASIDQAKANIEKNIENAKELFQSKLNGIFSQKGEGWEEKKLKSLTSKIGSGATPRGGKAAYKEEGISLIRSMNVHDEGFKAKNLAYIDEDQAKNLQNVSIEENDVLINITGASVARSCVVPEEVLPARVNQHVSILRTKKEILPQFLHFSLISSLNKKKLLGIGEQGSTRQAITKRQLENFKVVFPIDIDEQHMLVAEVIQFRQSTEKLLDIYKEKLYALEELKKSILQKAFAGELTQKDLKEAAV